MGFIKLDSSLMVYNISVFVESIAPGTHLLPSLVDIFSRLGLLYHWVSISIEIKFTSDLMRIKVVLLNVEGSRNFSFAVEG